MKPRKPTSTELKTLARYALWPTRQTALGRLLWQASFNSTMAAVLVAFSPQPLIALPLLLGLVAASVWVHGRWSVNFVVLCGFSGWATEVFLQWAGPMWTFKAVETFNPTGVPLYMLAGWALVGLFSVCLADYLRDVKKA
jgi:hypothetical protein